MGELLKAVFFLNINSKPLFFKTENGKDWVQTEPNKEDHYLLDGEPEKGEFPSDSDTPIEVRVFSLIKAETGYPAMLLLNQNKS